jgi:transposase
MPSSLPSTTEEIEAIYASGPVATVTLVQQLVQQLSTALQTNAELAQSNAELAQRIAELEERLGRNSRNSNQPPSTDGFNRPSPPRSLRRPTGKKPGGQPGHKGQTLRFSANPDRFVLHRPGQCAQCGCPLDDVPPSATERRQVIDLPPLALETVEHWAQSVRCPECANLNRGSFPPEAPESVQYGPHLKALCVYLMSYQLLPYERTTELLTDLFGAAPSQGTLGQAHQAAAQQLQPVEGAIRQSLRQAEVAHFDETGLYIGGKRHWLHVAATQHLTLYLAHPKRGEEGTKAMGVLPFFRGVAVHDGYQSFMVYECEHSLCNAHHLRELTAVEESEGGGQDWAGQMKELLVQIKGAVDAARDEGQQCLGEGSMGEFERRYREVVADGLEGNPPNPPPREPHRGRVKQSKAYNLLVRLGDHEQEVLRFMHDFRVPFDNNQAERDLRMAKVKQKVSGCFRSQQGAMAFCRIRGYISTLRKQGLHVLSALVQLFRGAPLMPSLVA